MQIKLETTTSDYLHFLKAYFFNRIFKKRLVFILLGALWCAVGRANIGSIILSTFLLKAVIFAIILFLLLVCLPYFIAKIKFQKLLKSNPSPASQQVVLHEDGIKITTENGDVLLKWLSIKTVAHVGDYVFVHLLSGKFYIFPYRAFPDNNEALVFSNNIVHHIEKDQFEIKNGKIKKLHYLGLLGFIPNIGVVVGIIILIRGFEYKQKSLILIGIGGILFTGLFWLVLLKFTGGNDLKEFSQMQLNHLVKDVEFYKLENGHYPDSLQQLLKEGQNVFIHDPVQGMFGESSNYNYEKTGDQYSLFSSGKDGIPNTPDDLYPAFEATDSSKIGWIRRKQ